MVNQAMTDQATADQAPIDHKINPYKGLFSYEESDQKLFFGRRREQRSLFRLVKHNFLTVIFGQSGIGKTSLLNAGLFPAIRKANFLPIPLRLDYASPGADLTRQVRETLQQEIAANHLREISMMAGEETTSIGKDESLWQYFHRVRHVDKRNNREITPVLVFDQFEEIFTLGKNHPAIGQFLNQLYYLIENQYPPEVKQKLMDDEEGLAYADAKPMVRLVITLREDYLPHLNSLKKRLPSITAITFRLLHLSGAQGREIINMPGGIRDEAVINDILRMFYPGDTPEDTRLEDEVLEIEPSILSLLCFQLMEKEDISSHTDKNIIIEDFYNSVMKDFPDKVQRFVETKLLTEGGFRTPLYLEPGNPYQESVNRLVDRRVLRKVYYGEKEHIEIIHDVLIPIIRDSRNLHSEAIKEKKMKEELEKRHKKRVLHVLAVTGFLSVLLALFALFQWNRANIQFHNAHINNLTFEAMQAIKSDHVRAIRIAEAAYKMTLPDPQPNAIQALNETAAIILGNPFYSAKLSHQKNTPHVRFSPDSGKILTASWDNSAALWDLKGNRLVHFTGHDDGLLDAQFSADGKRILTASWDKTARMWDITGKCLLVLNHDHYVYSARFSPDAESSRILTVSRDGTARLWNLNGKQLITFKHKHYVWSAVFSPDGSKILTTCEDYTAGLWDIDGTFLARFKHNGPVKWALFSPDGTRVLTASQDKTAALWNLNGKRLARFKHQAAINRARFSPDGKQVLTASRDKTAVLWDSSGNLVQRFIHDQAVNNAVFSPDGLQVLTACNDHFARLWNISGDLTGKYRHNSVVYTAIFSHNGKRILTGSGDGTAKLWTVKQIRIPHYTHQGPVNSALFSRNNLQILTASNDKTARRWDLDGKCLAVYKHKQAVTSALFSPDNKKILTASQDYTAGLWNLKGKRLATFYHKKAVRTAVFSPNSKTVLTASDDSTAVLWNLQGKKIVSFKGHTGLLSCAVLSPNGRLVLTASDDHIDTLENSKLDDHTAKLWSISGQLLVTLDKHEQGINSAMFSPDGLNILTASDDNTAKLWNLSGVQLASFKHQDSVTSAIFSRSGEQVLTAGADWDVKLWDLQGNLITTFSGHMGWVNSITFSPDGKQVLSASFDTTTKLWDLKGNILADFKTQIRAIRSAVFSHDGTWILTASDDHTVKRLYTTSAIIRWLETADIPHLTAEEEAWFGINK